MAGWVLVTGSSRGIGRAIALRLAADGYDLIIHCRSRAEQAQQVATEVRALGRQARVLAFDVGDRAATRAALAAELASFEAPYGIVCSAGISADNAFPALTDAEWDGVINTSLNGFYNVVQPLVMPMIRLGRGGRIVALSSVSGLIGNRGQVNYSAAKAGVIGAVKALALELAKRRITVNCVAPGLIETDMVNTEIAREVLPLVPLRRAGTPEEVAAAVSYLFRDEAAYVTRQVLSVNGGLI
jgi:3-oxoacyl-[acyl-carrier protein] reductase